MLLGNCKIFLITLSNIWFRLLQVDKKGSKVVDKFAASLKGVEEDSVHPHLEVFNKEGVEFEHCQTDGVDSTLPFLSVFGARSPTYNLLCSPYVNHRYVSPSSFQSNQDENDKEVQEMSLYSIATSNRTSNHIPSDILSSRALFVIPWELKERATQARGLEGSVYSMVNGCFKSDVQLNNLRLNVTNVEAVQPSSLCIRRTFCILNRRLPSNLELNSLPFHLLFKNDIRVWDVPSLVKFITEDLQLPMYLCGEDNHERVSVSYILRRVQVFFTLCGLVKLGYVEGQHRAVLAYRFFHGYILTGDAPLLNVSQDHTCFEEHPLAQKYITKVVWMPSEDVINSRHWYAKSSSIGDLFTKTAVTTYGSCYSSVLSQIR